MGPDDEGLGAEDGGEHEGGASHLASTRVGGRLATAWIEDDVRYVLAIAIAQTVGMLDGIVCPFGTLVNQKGNKASTWQKLFLQPYFLIVRVIGIE